MLAAVRQRHSLYTYCGPAELGGDCCTAARRGLRITFSNLLPPAMPTLYPGCILLANIPAAGCLQSAGSLVRTIPKIQQCFNSAKLTRTSPPTIPASQSVRNPALQALITCGATTVSTSLSISTLQREWATVTMYSTYVRAESRDRLAVLCSQGLFSDLL